MKVVENTPPTSTKAVPVAVILTVAACGLCMFGYNLLVRDRGAATCSCVAPDAEGSPGRSSTSVRAESMNAALATIAAATRESAQAGPSLPNVLPENPPPAPAQPAPPVAVSKEEILAKQRSDAHTLDAQLASEEVDPVWAPKVERATSEALARLGSNMHLDEVTCRETLCRARVSHADPRAHDEDVERLFNMPVLAGQALALSPADDPHNTVLYFSRKGTTLSVMQPPMRVLPPPGLSSEQLMSLGLDPSGAAVPPTDVN
jgi:hypothetical protein